MVSSQVCSFFLAFLCKQCSRCQHISRFRYFTCCFTDHPIIISGEKLLLMDPFKKERCAIFMTSLSEMTSEERQALHQALNPLLQLLPVDQRQLGWSFFCHSQPILGTGRMLWLVHLHWIINTCSTLFCLFDYVWSSVSKTSLTVTFCLFKWSVKFCLQGTNNSL
jgi:hypothetical protein